MELAQGTRLAQRFKVQACLGSGILGPVFLAQDSERGDQQIVVKTFPPAGASNPKIQERLKQEVALVSGIEHPHLARVLEYVQCQDFEAICFEYMPGGDLAHIIKKISFTAGEICSLLQQLSDGLSALHAHGVVHLGLKPSNVLISEDGTVKLAESGLFPLKVLEENQALRLHLGEGQYLAPEFLGQGKVGPTVDIFALGMLGFELLKKSADAFPEASSQELQVRSELEQVVRIAIDPDANQRFESASEFSNVLGSIQEQTDSAQRTRSNLTFFCLLIFTLLALAMVVYVGPQLTSRLAAF